MIDIDFNESLIKDCKKILGPSADINNVSIYLGKLTTYAKEVAEQLGWFDSLPEEYFDAIRFANDLIKDKQVLKVSALSLNDENGIWILNPDDFLSKFEY
jgi:hypothetical protein